MVSEFSLVIVSPHVWFVAGQFRQIAVGSVGLWLSPSIYGWLCRVLIDRVREGYVNRYASSPSSPWLN